MGKQIIVKSNPNGCFVQNFDLFLSRLIHILSRSFYCVQSSRDNDNDSDSDWSTLTLVQKYFLVGVELPEANKTNFVQAKVRPAIQ